MQEETNVTSAQHEQQQKEEQQEEERQDEEDEDDKDDVRTDSRDQNMQTIDQKLKEIKEETKKQKQQLADLEVVFAGMYRNGHLNTDGGDVLTDALLYERGLRTDEYVYSSLYGLFPHQARQLSKSIKSYRHFKSSYICRGCKKYECGRAHQYQGDPSCE